ncbi:TRAP transporter substrate-binding protein DctP [Desulfobacula sp.]|uniref:TRAP transporter substrate-binding protein DctP n=1 Tax=Desulfobacula sp. TaxID=2593537 RepID=UPI00260F9E88|nr:TRAP transporter substrate-binding protein DctP [Desulfobacula sp.]
MKKHLVGTIILLSSLFLFVVCANAADKPRVLSAVGLIPVDNINMKHIWQYKEWVENASKGQLIIDIKGAGEVIPSEEQIFALSKGRIDMIFSMGDDISQMTPLGSAMVLTGMPPWEEKEKGVWDFYREIIKRDCNAYWVGPLYTAQFLTLTTNVKAKSPGDLKGKKIRTGASYFDSVKAVGAIPVSVSLMEIYTAMERNTIDGFTMVPVGYTQFGWHEVSKYWVGPKLLEGSTPSCPLINQDVWESLSPQEQKWLTQPIIDHLEEIYAYHFWLYNGQKYGTGAMLTSGIERIEWSEKDNEAFKKTWDDALWGYVQKNMNPEDFNRFSKLVGHSK